MVKEYGTRRVIIVYEFKPSHAYDFAQFIGIRTFEKGEQLHFKNCPYCKGLGKGNERSFAIDLRTGQFNCLRASCNITGNMLTLARDFDFSLGTEIDEYYKPKKQYRRLKQPKEKIKPKQTALDYLQSRGISKEVIEQYEITCQKTERLKSYYPLIDK